MAYVKIEEKEVSLKGELVQILEIYDSALVAREDKDSEAVKAAKSSDVKDLPGLANKVKRTYGKIADKKLGTETKKLEHIHKKIDADAKEIYDCYVLYLTDMLVLAKKDASDTFSKVITSRYVLITELLKRLAALAVCTDNVKLDGEIYLDVMDNFVKKIIKENIISSKHTMFRARLSKHKEWISDLKQMVKMIKVFHAPEAATAHLLEYVESVKFIILRQILARLNSNVLPEHMQEQWLAAEIRIHENNHLKKSKTIATRDSQFAILDDQSIIPLVNSKALLKEGLNGELYKRYKLLRTTYCMSRTIGNLDKAIKGTGWVLFFANAINVDAMHELLVWYDDQCTDILRIDDYDKSYSKKAIAALTGNFALCSADPYDLDMGIKNLQNLKNPAILDRVKNTIVDSLNSISDSQKSLGFDMPIVNANVIKQLGHVTANNNQIEMIECGHNDKISDDNDNNIPSSDKRESLSSYRKITSNIPQLTGPESDINKACETLISTEFSTTNSKSKRKNKQFNKMVTELNHLLKHSALVLEEKPQLRTLRIIVNGCSLLLANLTNSALNNDDTPWQVANINSLCTLLLELQGLLEKYCDSKITQPAKKGRKKQKNGGITMKEFKMLTQKIIDVQNSLEIKFKPSESNTKKVINDQEEHSNESKSLMEEDTRKTDRIIKLGNNHAERNEAREEEGSGCCPSN